MALHMRQSLDYNPSDWLQIQRGAMEKEAKLKRSCRDLYFGETWPPPDLEVPDEGRPGSWGGCRDTRGGGFMDGTSLHMTARQTFNQTAQASLASREQRRGPAATQSSASYSTLSFPQQPPAFQRVKVGNGDWSYAGGLLRAASAPGGLAASDGFRFQPAPAAVYYRKAKPTLWLNKIPSKIQKERHGKPALFT
eukprot:gnl/TRDRNA2_/TRDRNA2_128282_c0_seq2.p1 gnl/TRDRNA2_/TRDRNA2_128282_c0~~gnl/TRDRNA2_/TRDRNA2_128282_c0_seq2.p1  ORF type:complete len:194 (+),score=31.21 gnl/TRDRNA2_/TRDRNA2_128282_c0_seq2:149-730(+)